jgi:hypothetical protein
LEILSSFGKEKNMETSIYLDSVKSLTEEYINANLCPEPIPFSKINLFPNVRGIYFIYDEINCNHLIYIGCAYKMQTVRKGLTPKGKQRKALTKKRTIKARCDQYISPSDTGGNIFRKKISEIFGVELPKVTGFIFANFCIKYVNLDELNEDSTLLIERILIDIYSPPLNDYIDI